jgi:hypothetical protein
MAKIGPQPLLNHRAEEKHRHREQQTDPEAVAKHLLVASVIHVGAVIGFVVGGVCVVTHVTMRVIVAHVSVYVLLMWAMIVVLPMGVSRLKICVFHTFFLLPSRGCGPRPLQ